MSLENPSIDPGRNVAAGSDDASDVEVARVLESYLAAVEAGQPTDPQRLLAEYPDLADRLRACLRVLKVAELAVGEGMAASVIPPGLSAASLRHDPRPGFGSLSTLDFGSGEPPHILLRDLADEPEPLTRPQSTAIPPNDLRAGRFQLQGEIARGGMGAVLRGRDVDLGRDLAIKVLLESHQRKPEVVRRFVEEAQIGGQLQHPGVVPVYELGTLPDRRPFFAMKLVKGRTLAALLHERADTTADLPRFLGIFEAVCQTVAYAHARGVIHRDLKPSNVMVGSFGEIQVMDWGLAKVLPSGGIADEGGSQPAQETVIQTVRSGSAGSGTDSQAGSVLGTPAYMAPEQARGEVEQIDERADVFGLGAILCEILTGQPPFGGSSREEIRAQAARGDLTDAVERLETCGADAELIDLARSCLRPERDWRPRNAGEVARRITAYLTGVQDRLKAAELARVEAQTRAEEAQKRARIELARRRLTVALAGSILGLVLLGGGGWAYLARQRTARLVATAGVVTDALAEAERFRGQAQSAAAGDLTIWSEAIGAAKRARDLLAQGEADAALRKRVTLALTDIEWEQEAAKQRAIEIERDHRFLSELEAIRGNRSEHWDPKRTDAEYAEAFRSFGIDLDQLDPKDAGRHVAARSEPLELASYLDDWALRRRQARDKKDEAGWRRLFRAAQAADPDPWRVAVRDHIGRNDREALQRLSADQKVLEAQRPASLVLLSAALRVQGLRDRAQAVLRRAWRLASGDFWISFELADVLWEGDRYDKPEEAIRFFTAAVAIRPRSPGARSQLGVVLRNQGRIEEAIVEYRTALRLKPDYAEAHNNLGVALATQGKLDEAVAEYLDSLRLKPDNPHAHSNLGTAFARQGKLAEAIVAYRDAVRLKPDLPNAHYNLGSALRVEGRMDEAIPELREALRLKSDYGAAHNNLGLALASQGNFEEAAAEYRAVLRLEGSSPVALNNLGSALEHEGKLEEAITAYREAVKSDLPEAHSNLGVALHIRGEYTEAIAELHKARDLVKVDSSVGLRTGLVKSDLSVAERIGLHLSEIEQEASLAPQLPAVIAGKLKPADAAETLGFARLCYEKKLHGVSARLWAEAFQAQPRLAGEKQRQNRYKAACAAAMAGSGKGKDEPPLEEAGKARWRKQAVEWLKADLAFWAKEVQSGPSEARTAVVQTLEHWKADPDLAGIRDQAALGRLPNAEQTACRALWAEVATLLAKARATAKP
jgi:serine/threonine-protein kinase